MQEIQNKTAVILNGSPRARGNTAVIAKWFEEALAQRNFTIKHHHLYRMHFAGCMHCDQCKKIPDQPGCILKDDFTPVLQDLADADLILIASPIYFWSISGSMCTALDRIYALCKRGPTLLAGKKMLGAFTCGGDYFDGMELCVTMLKHICAYTGTDYVGTLAAVNCDDTKELLLRTYLKEEIAKLLGE